MAGDWIKMRSNLWDDPRVARMVDMTDSSEAAVIGALYWLWTAADQHTEDGFMPGLTPRQIDRKTGVAGMAVALQGVGWITVDDDGITIERFGEHNGASAKSRAAGQKRTATHRANACNGKALQDRHLEKEIEVEKKQEQKHVQPAAAPVDAEPAALPADIAPPAGPAPDAKPDKRKPQTAVEFPKFWAAYPVKKGKADALKAWKKHDMDSRVDELIAHVRMMEREDEQWQRGFIPHPATYLNGERWNDVPMKDKDQVRVTAPPPPPEKFGAKAALEPMESKLQHAISYAHQRWQRGDFGTGPEAIVARDAEIAEARAKHAQ